MSDLVFTQLVQDNFQRPNESPLNSSVWTAFTSGNHFDSSGLQIVTQQCESAISPNGAGLETYTGISWPNDQYAEVTFAPEGSGNWAVRLRNSNPQSPNASSYVFQLSLEFGISPTVGLGIFRSDGTLLTYLPGGEYAGTGTFLCAVAGSTLFAYQNGTLIAEVVDTNSPSISSGSPSISLGAGSFLLGEGAGGGPAILSNFAGGSVTSASNKSTLQTVIQGRFQGTGVQNAFPQNSRGLLDLMQIKSRSGDIVWKLDYQGIVTANPLSFTNGTILGQFSGSSWGDAFIANNANPYQFDILQVYEPTGTCIWFLDYTGTAYSVT